MASSPPEPVTVSAPGKMLLAGGYLVLERPNVGWVVAANKRFYTTVKDNSSAVDAKNIIEVHSPQFHTTWRYEFDPSTSNLQPSLANTTINDFVEKTLRVCFLYLFEQGETPDISLSITIRADNDFYSVLPHLPEGSPRTPEAVEKLPRFLNCPTDEIGKPVVHKTGLGSSAALTTSLVGALVQYFQPETDIVYNGPVSWHGLPESTDDDDEEETEDKLTAIHNLAQICHCHAQGKVGSGFDVSAACYGTHVYQRFPRCMLPDLLGQLDHEASMGGTNAKSALDILAKTIPWAENMVNPLPLPHGQLQVLLADVQGGSESPSMAKAVLKWKQSQINSPHWSDLQTLNMKVVKLVEGLLSSEGNDSIDYDTFAAQPASEWPESSPLKELHSAFVEIRTHLKGMGKEAGVPIEPEEQTKLCDATSQLPGVVCCIVPGAGGNDAVACLYIDRPTVRDGIGALWASWESPVICPLSVEASDEGLRVEPSEPK